MSKKVQTILTVLLWTLMAVSTVLIVSLVSNVEDPMTEKGDALVNLNITWTYILFFASVGLTILFSIYHLLTSGKDAIKSILGLVAIAVVVGIAYAMASPAIPQFTRSAQLVAEGILTPQVAKTTDTLLYTTYMLFGGAVLAVIYSSVSRIWK